MVASFNGFVDVVCVLIEAHANIHAQNKVQYVGHTVHRLSDVRNLVHTGWLDSTSQGVTRRPF